MRHLRWIHLFLVACQSLNLAAAEVGRSASTGVYGIVVTSKREHAAINGELSSRTVLGLVEKELKLDSGTLDSQMLEVELYVGNVGAPDELTSVSLSILLRGHKEHLNGISLRLDGYALARLKGYSQKYALECMVLPPDTPIEVQHIKRSYTYVNLSRLKQQSPPVKKGSLVDYVYELVDEHSRVVQYLVRTNESGELVSVGEL